MVCGRRGFCEERKYCDADVLGVSYVDRRASRLTKCSLDDFGVTVLWFCGGENWLGGEHVLRFG